MRKIIATAFVSLDGVMQAPGGPEEDPSGGFDLGGWHMKYAAKQTGAAVMALVGTPEKPHDLLLGRTTYDIFAGYWPHVPADNPISSVFNQTRKYVLTHRTDRLEWANSHAVRGIDEVQALKAADGPDLVLWGSSTLYPPLLEANLIDRLQLLIAPVLLGKGKRLSASAAHPVDMTLVSCETSSTGVIVANYEVRR